MWNGTHVIGLSHTDNLSLFHENGSTVLNSSFLEDEQEDVFQLPYFRIPLILAYSFVFLCCFLGNLTVMVVVVLHRRMRTATNFFLANLALADFCVGIFCVYQNLMLYLSHAWTLGDFFCRIYHFIHGLSYTASILFLTVISLERYVVIVHPMWGKRFITLRRLRLVLIILWLVSAIYNCPRLFLYSTFKVRSWLKHKEYSTLCIIRWSIYKSAHFDFYNFIFLFVFPLMAMAILYTRITLKLWRSEKLHGGKTKNFICCCVGKMPKSKASGTTDKKSVIKEVPAEETTVALNESTPNTLHENTSTFLYENPSNMCKEENNSTLPERRTDFESSGAEEEEEDERKEDDEQKEDEERKLLDVYRRESKKSIFSRNSFSRSGGVHEQRGSLKTTHSVLINEDMTSDAISKCKTNAESRNTECLPKTELFAKYSDNNVTFSDDFQLQDCVQKKASAMVERLEDIESVSGDQVIPIAYNSRRFKSLPTEPTCLSTKERVSPIRRGSAPPIYIRTYTTGRRGSEPIAFMKSLLQRSQNDDSPDRKLNKCLRRSRSKVLRSRRKVVRFLIIILWAFAICNLPYHVRKFWQAWSTSYEGSSNTSLFVTISTTLFLYMNSGINPFLYAYLSSNFRKCIRDVFSVKTHMWNRHTYSPKRSTNSKMTLASSSTSTSRRSASSAASSNTSTSRRSASSGVSNV